MRYYLIAGEASGDLHGSNLVKALKAKDPEAEFKGWGGDKMNAAGVQLSKHYKEVAYMGFLEVASHLPDILRNIYACRHEIQTYQPDVVILIDYPGFNLRIASWAKKEGFKVVYYISPQVWAWKESRVKKIKASVDKMLVILPFEKKFYADHGMDVVYVGHPLLEVVNHGLEQEVQPLSERPIIALLPGSRMQEIRFKLPIMLKMAKFFPEFQFIVAKAPSVPNSVYKIFMDKHPDVIGVEDDTYNLLKQARAALVTSGTATLETALFAVPEVVCYKGNSISYRLAKWLIRVKYISLVNLILDRPAVKELIQKDFNEKNLKKELDLLLNDLETQDRLQTDYAALTELLGSGNASEKAAKEIVEVGKAGE